MLNVTEYLPQFQAFAQLQLAYANGEMDDSELDLHAQTFCRSLEHLQGRLNWELPLLGGFSEANAAIKFATEPLERLLLRLRSNPAEELILANLEQCANALERIQYFFQQLPTFVDVEVVNELLILGAQPDPKPEHIQHRLEAVMGWLREVESGWEEFRQLYPARHNLALRAEAEIEKIKTAVGALYLYTQGEEPDILRPSLGQLVRTLESLAPLEETRFWDESQDSTFSPDLRLERAAKQLTLHGRLPQRYQANLLRWIDEKFLVLAEISGWLRISGYHDPTEIQPFILRLESLRKQVSKFDRDHITLLQNLEQWRQDFEETRKVGIP